MESNQKSNGALVGAIIIIILLIVGGFYLIKTKVNNIRQEDIAQQELINQANALSSSDEFQDIEADLEANGNLDPIDQNLQ